MEAPAVIVLETPCRNFLQGKTLEDHFATRSDHLHRLCFNGLGSSAKQQFLYRDSAGFLHQRDSARTACVRPCCGAANERGSDGDDGEIQKTSDARAYVLNNHSSRSSNT